MANPSVKTITAGQWIKVATNVTSGVVNILDDTPNKYYQTYRDTGGGAPANGNLSEAIPFDKQFIISAGAGIDVYVACSGDVNGSVRVDL